MKRLIHTQVLRSDGSSSQNGSTSQKLRLYGISNVLLNPHIRDTVQTERSCHSSPNLNLQAYKQFPLALCFRHSPHHWLTQLQTYFGDLGMRMHVHLHFLEMYLFIMQKYNHLLYLFLTKNCMQRQNYE